MNKPLHYFILLAIAIIGPIAVYFIMNLEGDTELAEEVTPDRYSQTEILDTTVTEVEIPYDRLLEKPVKAYAKIVLKGGNHAAVFEPRELVIDLPHYKMEGVLHTKKETFQIERVWVKYHGQGKFSLNLTAEGIEPSTGKKLHIYCTDTYYQNEIGKRGEVTLLLDIYRM